MNRRQKIIVSVTGIFLVLLLLVGLTYAYFLTQVTGNTNTKSISVSTANLALDWIDGTDNLIDSSSVIIPGKFESSITFSVKNNGNATIEDYGIIIDDLRVKIASENEEEQIDTNLSHPEDFELNIICSSDKGKCEGKDTFLPTTNEVLLTNDILEGEMHTYTVTLKYVDSGKDQSADMNKTITARLDIIDTKNTTILTGRVTNYEPGDYIQTNSVERISSIDKNGNYKIVGLELGNHTISIRDKSGSTITSKLLNLNKEDNRLEINVDRATKAFTGGTVKINPYQEGTLAYEIINNAQNVSLTEEMKGYAYYRETPLTTPGKEVSGEKEASLSITNDYFTETTNIPSYYYRGNIKNNFINYAGMCWRIVRIQGDGSVKLTLADFNYECNNPNYNIENELVNENEEPPNFDIPETYEVYNHIETKWCNDKSIYKINDCEDCAAIYTDYNSWKRYSDGIPSLNCNFTGLDNTKSILETGKIGSLTYDEIAYAGIGQTKNSYTYITNNIGMDIPLLNPFYYEENGDEYYPYLTPNGNIEINYGQFFTIPSIVLDKNILVGGKGTQKDPYRLPKKVSIEFDFANGGRDIIFIEGMTWREWANSKFNTEYKIKDNKVIFYETFGSCWEIDNDVETSYADNRINIIFYENLDSFIPTEEYSYTRYYSNYDDVCK